MPIATANRTIHNPVQDDTATFLETAAESGGRRTVLDITVGPGGGNMLHRHLTYAEHFEVLEGTLTVQLGRNVLRLGPGETATAPARAAHRWANESDEPIRFRVTTTPGHEGFEQALVVGYGLAADGLVRANGTPRKLSHLALLATMSDIRVVGPLAVLTPLLGVIARVARRRGVERELLERYA